MSNGNHVRPGEVISSNLINQMLDRIAALEEGNGGPGNEPGPGPRVIAFDPPGGQAIGGIMTIFGTDLPFPATGNSVLINNQPVALNFMLPANSNRERLEFVIPDIGVLAPQGEVFQIRVVSDGRPSEPRSYRIRPDAGGPPAPNITRVTPLSGNTGNSLAIGGEVAITGTDFSLVPGENIITLQPQPNGNTYPLLARDPIAITIVSANELRFTVPEMEEVTVGVGLVRTQLTLEVSGAPRTHSVEVFVVKTDLR